MYFHFGVGLLIEFVLLPVFIVGVVDSIQISLEIGIGQFIGGLKLSIIFVMLLNSIVCEVNEFVVEVFHVELFRSSPDVSVLEPIAFLVSIDASQTHVASNVELSLLVKERHDVLLHNVSTRAPQSINFFSLNDLLYLLKTLDHLYPIASIRILAWFH